MRQRNKTWNLKQGKSKTEEVKEWLTLDDGDNEEATPRDRTNLWNLIVLWIMVGVVSLSASKSHNPERESRIWARDGRRGVVWGERGGIGIRRESIKHGEKDGRWVTFISRQVRWEKSGWKEPNCSRMGDPE